jgi:hypothetical protein
MIFYSRVDHGGPSLHHVGSQAFRIKSRGVKLGAEHDGSPEQRGVDGVSQCTAVQMSILFNSSVQL